jgi:hypothetical protein
VSPQRKCLFEDACLNPVDLPVAYNDVAEMFGLPSSFSIAINPRRGLDMALNKIE